MNFGIVIAGVSLVLHDPICDGERGLRKRLVIGAAQQLQAGLSDRLSSPCSNLRIGSYNVEKKKKKISKRSEFSLVCKLTRSAIRSYPVIFCFCFSPDIALQPVRRPHLVLQQAEIILRYWFVPDPKFTKKMT